MKKINLAILIGCALLGANASAQIPTTDVANMVQTFAHQVEEVKTWTDQIKHMKTQLEQQKKAFEAISGSRGLGNLLNNPQLKNALPQDWQQVYSSIQNGGYSGLTGAAKAIRDANKVYDCISTIASQKTLCERQAVMSSQNKAFAQNAYAAAQARLDNIQGLMNMIDQTTDAKSIAELGARMQAEQAMIQNEQTKLQMFRMLAQAEKELVEQQKLEHAIVDFNKPSKARDGSLRPVKFGQ